jgi:hypothetical protein
VLKFRLSSFQRSIEASYCRYMVELSALVLKQDQAMLAGLYPGFLVFQYSRLSLYSLYVVKLYNLRLLFLEKLWVLSLIAC